MRPNEYNELLKKIRCSDDFRKRMQAKLSSPSIEVHEYEDSVSGTEVITAKHRWGKFAAMAAAFVLVCGAVGGGAYHFSKINDIPEINEDISDESIYDIVKANKKSYDMSEYVFNNSAGPNILVRKKSDYKDELFEYLASLEGVRKVENYPAYFRSVRFSFKDSKSGKRFDFSMHENGYGLWVETVEDKNAAFTSPNMETYYYGKDVFDKLFNKVLENADSETIEAMSMASQEEIMGFVSTHLENSDDKAVYYPWQSYNDSEIREYSITDKTELINSLMKFEWVKIKESEFEYYDWYDMGIRISEEGYIMAVDEDPNPYGCYKLKNDSDLEAFRAVLKKHLIKKDFGEAASKEDILNAFHEGYNGGRARFRVDDGQFTEETECTLENFESFKDELSDFEWVTCKVDEPQIYENFYVAGALISRNGYIYPQSAGTHQCAYKLKNESDVEKLCELLDKYIEIKSE